LDMKRKLLSTRSFTLRNTAVAALLNQVVGFSCEKVDAVTIPSPSFVPAVLPPMSCATVAPSRCFKLASISQSLVII
jgi:hypothetical protein